MNELRSANSAKAAKGASDNQMGRKLLEVEGVGEGAGEGERER